MYSEYINYLKKALNEHRFQHSLNVADECAVLAQKYDYDSDRAYLCGLLHDVCKNDSKENMLKIFNKFGIMLDDIQKTQFKLWHSIAGAAFIQEKFSVNDREIIDAIRYHTTGRENMTKLDKILYLADFISADRNFEGVDALRKAASDNLDKAVVACLKFSINELCEINKPIHIDTLKAYNSMIIEKE